MEIHEFQLRARLDGDALRAWIEARWLVPARIQGRPHFSEVDLARAQLIADLTRDLGVNDEGVPIILSLVDQIHALRRSLGAFVEALGAQPEEVRRLLLAELQGKAAGGAQGAGTDPGSKQG